MSRKKNLFIVLLLSSSLIEANDTSSAIQKQIGTIVSLPFGSQATPQTTEYVNSVNTKFDAKISEVNVKAMNKFAEYLFGYQNAIALPFLNVLLVNEKWFTKLPEEQKRFLVGRSLAHMSKPFKYTLYKYILPLLTNIGTQLLSDQEQLKLAELAFAVALAERNTTSRIDPANRRFWNSLDEYSKLNTIDQATRLTGSFIAQYFSRSLEYQADKESAQKLDCAQGGIELLQNLAKFKNDKTWIGRWFSTLPMINIVSNLINGGLHEFASDHRKEYSVRINDIPVTLVSAAPAYALNYIRDNTPGRLTNRTNKLENWFMNLPIIHYFMSYPRDIDRITALKKSVTKINKKTDA